MDKNFPFALNMVKIAYFAAVIETKKWPFLDFSFKEWKNTFCGIFGFINCSCIYDFYLLRWNRMNGITRLENYWFFRSMYCKFTSYYRNIWSKKIFQTWTFLLHFQNILSHKLSFVPSTTASVALLEQFEPKLKRFV